MKVFNNSGIVECPNYYNIPLKAVIFFKNIYPEEAKIKEFSKVAAIDLSGRMAPPPFRIIESIYFEGNNKFMNELSDKIFWLGWSDNYRPQ